MPAVVADAGLTVVLMDRSCAVWMLHRSSGLGKLTGLWETAAYRWWVVQIFEWPLHGV